MVKAKSKQTKRRNSKSKKGLYVFTVVVLLAAGVIAVLEATNTTHLLHKSSNTTNSGGIQSTVSGTTSTPTPHQTPTNTSTNNSGGAVDQNGNTSGSLPPSSQWTSSSSGNITLQQPTAGSTVQSGDTLSGLAKVDNVRFVLSDDSVGLIAQGDLSVASGKFSGALHFTPHSRTGKLEVYYPNPNNGAQEDRIQVSVNFNP